MCGIFAYSNGSGNPAKKRIDLINKLFMFGVSRGPESSKTMVIGNLFLGFHRLAINGLDSGSNQPFNINGIYLICNGEIYNYRDFATRYSFVSNSDCEVIIHLYLEFGIEYTLRCLDGVFAFVLYDSITDKIYAARDPFGVRPLFKLINSGIFAVASELKQLSELGDVEQFEPGTYLDVENGFHKRYYNFGITTKVIKKNVFYGSLFDAVRKRVVGTTERPIACLLSGGLDSSTIAAMVNSHLPKGQLETYSIGLEGSTDLVYAQQVADHLGTKHTSIVLTEQQFFDAIPAVIYAIESYDITTVRASVGNYLVGKYISEHSDAKVIFNGDGADELMGGYRYFNYCPNDLEFDRECRRLLNNIHYFDVLRSDRCISTHGLEPRTPFLDKSFVEMYLSIPSTKRYHVGNKVPEKSLIRQVLKEICPDLLPDAVLFRTKEAFSDGVSSVDRSWYKIIGEYLGNKSEKEYYLEIFDSYFLGKRNVIPYQWMPKYIEATDPSARTI